MYTWTKNITKFIFSVYCGTPSSISWHIGDPQHTNFWALIQCTYYLLTPKVRPSPPNPMVAFPFFSPTWWVLSSSSAPLFSPRYFPCLQYYNNCFFLLYKVYPLVASLKCISTLSTSTSALLSSSTVKLLFIQFYNKGSFLWVLECSNFSQCYKCTLTFLYTYMYTPLPPPIMISLSARYTIRIPLSKVLKVHTLSHMQYCVL